MASPAKTKRGHPSNSEDEADEPHLAKRQHTAATTTTPVIVPASLGAVNDPAAPTTLPASSGAAINLTTTAAPTTEPATLDAFIATAHSIEALGVTFARNNSSSGTVNISLAAIKFIQKAAETDTNERTTIAMQQVFAAIRNSPKAIDIVIFNSYSNRKTTICAQEDWTFAKVTSDLRQIKKLDGLILVLMSAAVKVDTSLTVGEWVSQGRPQLFAILEKFWKI